MGLACLIQSTASGAVPCAATSRTRAGAPTPLNELTGASSRPLSFVSRRDSLALGGKRHGKHGREKSRGGRGVGGGRQAPHEEAAQLRPAAGGRPWCARSVQSTGVGSSKQRSVHPPRHWRHHFLPHEAERVLLELGAFNSPSPSRLSFTCAPRASPIRARIIVMSALRRHLRPRRPARPPPSPRALPVIVYVNRSSDVAFSPILTSRSSSARQWLRFY